MHLQLNPYDFNHQFEYQKPEKLRADIQSRSFAESKKKLDARREIEWRTDCKKVGISHMCLVTE